MYEPVSVEMPIPAENMSKKVAEIFASIVLLI
jgi:hypothetical protein